MKRRAFMRRMASVALAGMLGARLEWEPEAEPLEGIVALIDADGGTWQGVSSTSELGALAEEVFHGCVLPSLEKTSPLFRIVHVDHENNTTITLDSP